MAHRSLLELSFGLIQEVRLLQAIAEVSEDICVPEEHRWKLLRLQEDFGLDIPSCGHDAKPLGGIHIDHSEPLTRIGRLSRPLVFPVGIVERCREFWSPAREFDFTFVGLLTPSRYEVLRDWAEANATSLRVTPTFSVSQRMRLWARLGRYLALVPLLRGCRLGRLRVWNSRRGRTFPGKVWDPSYFKTLGASKFVLCPNGDFVWSYRFFESILCGAIPLVQESLPLYAGFTHYMMDKPIEELVWSQDIAEANWHRCVALITIDKSDLQGELLTLQG